LVSKVKVEVQKARNTQIEIYQSIKNSEFVTKLATVNEGELVKINIGSNSSSFYSNQIYLVSIPTQSTQNSMLDVTIEADDCFPIWAILLLIFGFIFGLPLLFGIFLFGSVIVCKKRKWSYIRCWKLLKKWKRKHKPHKVSPSPIEIKRNSLSKDIDKIKVLGYTKQKDCMIWLDPLNTLIINTACNHIFHTDWLSKWKEVNNAWPYWRQKL
jgi:hypothetical protein